MDARRWLVVVMALAACTGGEVSEGPAAGPAASPIVVEAGATPSPPPPAGLEQGGWTLLRVSPDGLEIIVGAHSGGCHELLDVQVVEDDEAVDIATFGPVPDPEEACNSDSRLAPATILLDAPLDTRELRGCGRTDCRTPGESFSSVEVPSLALDRLPAGDVVLSGTIRGPEGGPVEVMGVAALDPADGAMRWASAYEPPDAGVRDEVGTPRVVDDLVAVDLAHSGGVALFTPDGEGPLALVNGMSNGTREVLGDRWFGNQKLTSNLMALDLSVMSAVWEGGDAVDFAPARTWAVDAEVPVGPLDPDRLVTQAFDREGGGDVRLRGLADGDVLGGGTTPDGTRLLAVGVDAIGSVAVGVAGDTLVALDPLMGAVRWQVDAAPLGLRGQEVVDIELLEDAGGAVVVVLDRTSLVAVDVVDGSRRWVARLGEVAARDRPLVVDGDTVVMIGEAGTVMAHRRSDGEEVWAVPVVEDQRFPVPVAATPVVADGVLVLAVDDGAVGLDLATGARRWETTLAAALAE